MKAAAGVMDTEAAHGRTCVLVVQDEPILAMAMAEFVEEAGCAAVVVVNAARAIATLEARTDIRLVFADIDTRDALLGLTMAATIRDRWPPIELILVSTQPWAAVDLPARGIVVGKPFDEARIVAAIRGFTA